MKIARAMEAAVGALPAICQSGWLARIPLGCALDVLAPNQLYAEKFREGYRKAKVDALGMRDPPGLHRVGDAMEAIRRQIEVAFRELASHCRIRSAAGFAVILALQTCRALDDDAWFPLLKPVLDGMTDARLWKKDRGRIFWQAGYVARYTDREDSLAVSLCEVLS